MKFYTDNITKIVKWDFLGIAIMEKQIAFSNHNMLNSKPERNALTKHWAFSEKPHIWKIRNFWNEITEKNFFSISKHLYFWIL